MIVAVDCNVLVAWSTLKADSPNKARLDALFEQIGTARGVVLVPTPALAEFLTKTNDATTDWLAGMERKAAFRIVPFDRRAAFECALLDKAAIGTGDKKAGRTDSWQKIKIDRQLVAVARANNATHLVSDDEKLRGTARGAGLEALAVAELLLPDHAKQTALPFGSAAGQR